jgi:hypothetical protein
MRFRILGFAFLCLFLVSSLAADAEDGPVAVSPASELGIAKVKEICPTFSWTAMADAAAYRVEVFPALENAEVSHSEMTVLSLPVLIKEIRGAATSWTPGAEECLRNGSRYTWYVQAIDAHGSGNWSKGSDFSVEVTHWSSDLDVIVGEALEEHGMESELIPEVLKRIRKRAENSSTDGSESQANTVYTAPMFSIQGSETTNNTLFGLVAGASLTSGVENTLLGYYAGNLITSGYGNTIIGSVAGRNNTTGGYNVFMGQAAGHVNSTASYNTFLGFAAGRYNTTGTDNTYIGLQTGYNNLSGSNNVALGRNAGAGSSSPSPGSNTGYENVCIGGHTGSSITSGHGNIFLGYRAGYNETGSNKLFIDNSDTSSPLFWGDFENDIAAVNGNFGVGTMSPAFPMVLERTGTNGSIVVVRTDGATNYINATDTFGNFGTVNNFPLRLVVDSVWRMRLNSDNSLTMKNGATCSAVGVWTNASSRDLKENIQSLSTNEAVEALESLDPVKYNYKADQEDKYVGFIAEDAPELVASKDRKGMSSMDVVAVLTKVVQEQQKMVEDQQKVVAELQKSKAELEKRLSELENKTKK